jgi:hypothetical protein
VEISSSSTAPGSTESSARTTTSCSRAPSRSSDAASGEGSISKHLQRHQDQQRRVLGGARHDRRVHGRGSIPLQSVRVRSTSPRSARSETWPRRTWQVIGSSWFECKGADPGLQSLPCTKYLDSNGSPFSPLYFVAGICDTSLFQDLKARSPLPPDEGAGTRPAPRPRGEVGPVPANQRAGEASLSSPHQRDVTQTDQPLCSRRHVRRIVPSLPRSTGSWVSLARESSPA